ncbi:hypothetical protein Tco_1211960 [Tanacetum coccineum]
MLLEMAKLIKNNRILFNRNLFPHEEMSMRALLAEERILKLIQDWDEYQIKPWSLPELLLQLFNDSQTIEESLKQKRIEHEQAANLAVQEEQAVQKEQEEPVAQSFLLNWNFPMVDDDEYTIIYRKPKAITPDLPTEEPEDSFIMGDEELGTIPEKKSDEVIKYSVEDLVPIPSESEDTSESDNDCDLPSCDDFSPINVYEEKSVTLSNPLFDSNNDFTSSDDESLSDEDVPEDNFKIYSNPLFEFDDEYISSDVNSLFDEVLEDIEFKDSYDSNLDVSTFLVTPLSDSNEDECLAPSGDVELILHHDPSISVVSILEGFTDEPPLEENDDLFDLESKENDWKKILYDALIDDLITEDKVFDPGIYEKFFSPTFGNLPSEDHHYLSLTYVVRIFLPYFTYSVDSSLPLSSGSEDTIFDPDIFAFHFSLEPVASHRSETFMCFNVYLNILNESPMEIFSSTCFVPNITMIWGESS